MSEKMKVIRPHTAWYPYALLGDLLSSWDWSTRNNCFSLSIWAQCSDSFLCLHLIFYPMPLLSVTLFYTLLVTFQLLVPICEIMYAQQILLFESFDLDLQRICCVFCGLLCLTCRAHFYLDIATKQRRGM